MKVFEVFDYNLNQIKFKQNKEFFDALFEEMGFEYSDISFMFTFDQSGDICQKAIKLFPALEEYKHYYAESELYQHSMPEYRLSSVFLNQDGTLNCSIKHEHHNAFDGLLKKIPHSVNFPFMGVVLDKANWYNDEALNDVLLSNTTDGIIHDFRFCRYLSNSVRFFKEFDYGNKRNYIEVVIDRTKDYETLREYPEKFEEFINKLGKPRGKCFCCGFDETERKLLEDAKDKINEWKKQKDYSHHFAGFGNRERNLIDSVTPVSNYSPKMVLNRVAKSNNYKYVRCVNGCYIYKKVNENNHSFVVEFTFRPFSLYVDASVSVEGYNFSHFMHSDNELSAKDKDILESYAKAAFEAANEIEKDASEMLYKLYKKTPDWFINQGT